MTKILGVSGRKQAGKSSAVNCLFGHILTQIELPDGGPLVSGFKIDRKGRLIVPAAKTPMEVYNTESDTWEPSADYSEGILDINSTEPDVYGWLSSEVHPYIKSYSFADALKEEVCIKILGLKREGVFGTDEQKNEKSHIRWEDLPIPRSIYADEKVLKAFLSKRGFLTNRQVMQFVGTKLFREMYNTCWVDETIRRIQSEGSDFALSADVRFPNEVEAIQKAGGKVIRLTRIVHPEDNDESETALDEDKYDWSKFDGVVKNDNSSIDQQHNDILELLKGWGW